MKKFFQKQIGYLLAGIIIWLPLIIVVMAGGWAFNAIENTGRGILDIFPFSDALPPGTGFSLIIFSFYLSGILFKKTFAKKIVARIPILRFFVEGEGTTMSLERLLSAKPCLFLFAPTCPSFGFILSEEKVFLNGKESSFGLLNVYLPNIPMLITGQTFPVRKEVVMRIGNSAREIIDLLLYSSKSPKSIRYLPWGDETEEDFKRRAEKFGLFKTQEN